jgi:methyl-accepting chemotaxis protein
MPRKPAGSGRSVQNDVAGDPARDRSRSQAQTRPDRPSGPGMKVAGPKSLMKTADLGARNGGPRRSGGGLPLAAVTEVAGARHRKPFAPASAPDRRQKIEERLVAASEELASGITESASAAEELRRAMEQIASGAEEAATASQQTLAVAANTAATLVEARTRTQASQRRTETLQGLLAETANQIGTWASNIKHNGERQAGSVVIIEQLSEQAVNIGDVTKTVGQVSDQTNLLALNAAIEAARAGDHGRGFAVVADEVRALAETSEKSARDAQSLAGQIQEQVKSVAATVKAAANSAAAEAEKSQTVILALGELRKETGALAQLNQSIATAAIEAEAAAREAQKGAEIISSAAEEQAAAAAEALRAVEQQAAALNESQSAAESVAGMATNLDVASHGDGSAHRMASAAEQLSTTVQQISGAATQIMLAVEQIGRGGQQQASATQEASAALAQIEKMAGEARQRSTDALDRAKRMQAMLVEIRSTIGDLSAGVTRSLESTRASLGEIAGLERISRSVDKIVDGIGMVSIQINMLAINGSVEAARAGDFGKGFAVVSKDIRSLARDSGENAGRIKDTVQAIQDQIAAVRRELEQTIAAAEVENQKNVGVLASLGVVEADMNEIAIGSDQIRIGAEAILSSIKEATRGAQQVAAAAEQAGSAAAQAATAAKQQAGTAEDLAAAIEEIASLAQDIQRRNG